MACEKYVGWEEVRTGAERGRGLQRGALVALDRATYAALCDETGPRSEQIQAYVGQDPESLCPSQPQLGAMALLRRVRALVVEFWLWRLSAFVAIGVNFSNWHHVMSSRSHA